MAALVLNSLGCEPYPGSKNHHGQPEIIEGVEFTHWFTSVLRSRYHYVTAGDPEKPVVIFLHGLPESWYAFHFQMCAMADEFFCIGIDLKGYGQSEKSLLEEYSFPHCAFELGLLIDKLGIEEFSLVTHDRGSVIADHLCNLPNGFDGRIYRYARLQQSANHPHAEPRPPHRLFSSSVGSLLFNSSAFPTNVYETRPVSAPPEDVAIRFFGALEALKVPISWRRALFRQVLKKGGSEDATGHQLTHGEIPAGVIQRIHDEFHYPGIAEAVPLTFRLTNFDKEYEDRVNFLFEKMTMPVCFIQGELDPGQPRSDYDGIEQVRDNFSVKWIEGAGHFLHLEQPARVTAALRTFLSC